VILQRIVDRLILESSLKASVEYPDCIVIPHGTQPGRWWWFGTVNPTWMGDLLDRDATVYETVDTGVSRECRNEGEVADAIAAAVNGARHLCDLVARQQLTAGKLLELLQRCHAVIEESVDVDEHLDLTDDLEAAIALIDGEIGGSHMGTGADVVLIERGEG